VCEAVWPEARTARCPSLKSESLLRLLKRPQGASRTPPAGQAHRAGAERLLLIAQAEICVCGYRRGVIRVATQSFRGLSKCRTLEELLDLLDPAVSSGALIAALW